MKCAEIAGEIAYTRRTAHLLVADTRPSPRPLGKEPSQHG
jgi:hypothetical protein